MSEQLKRNGHAVGSQAYFTELDWENDAIRNTGRVMDHCYSDMLEHLAERAEQTLDTIWWDYSKYANVIRYFPVRERERMMELVKGLGDLAECGGKSTSRVSHILSLLKLSSLVTGGKSHASVSEIERWCEPVIRGKYLSTSRQTELLKKASESNTVSLSDKREAEFLNAVCLGKSREVLSDMLLCAKYRIEHTRYTGECGYELGSERYVAWAEGRIFKKRPENLHVYAFAACFEEALERVAQTIREDLKNGERRGDFLKDEEAELLRQAVQHLEKCGIACYDINNIIDKLDWYVGGEEAKILRLQKALNTLGVGQIKEDGIFGPRTHEAWFRFMNILAKGSVPNLTRINPLQSDITGIIVSKINDEISTLRDVSGRAIRLKADGTRRGITVFRVDDKNGDLHLNMLNGMEVKKDNYVLTKTQNIVREKLNHVPISKKTYNVLKDFDNIKTPIRIGGRILAVTGVALDAYRLGTTVYSDLNDADGKLGKATAVESASIAGGWAGGAVFAKAGTWLGAQIGTAILPGVGTLVGGILLGVAFGCIGAYGGEELAEWVVELNF